MSNLTETIDQYLNTIKGTRSENTLETYAQGLRAFVEVVGDAVLTPETYQTFLINTKGMNPSTQATYRVAIMGLYLFYAASHPEMNFAALRQVNKQYAKRKGKRLPNFDWDAVEKLITYCSTIRNSLLDLRDRAFVLALADTGLRISEACGLFRGDIDYVGKQALVIGKGDKQAPVYFSDRALDAIREYLTERAKLDGASQRPLASLPLFARHDIGAGKKVKPVKSGGMWAAIKERAKEAGVDPKTIRVHDLRHYFITTVQLIGQDIKLTQELARHTDVSTTGRYAHMGGKASELYRKIFNENSTRKEHRKDRQ